jgi:uncharacterized protein
MFIEQAYTKKFDFTKYLPIPIVFFILMLFNYVAILMLDMDTEQLIKQQIKQSSENAVFFQTLLPLVIFLLLLLAWVKFFHKQTIRSLTTARPSVDWKRIFVSFGLWGAISGGFVAMAYFSEPESFVWNFKTEPFLILLVLSVIMIPMQTSFEEYLFRGYLMQGLGLATRSTLFALLFTSITFGLMHIANPEVDKFGPILLLYYIGTGLFLGILTLMDDGMELALGFHAANNLVASLLVTSDWTALQTPSLLKDVSQPSPGADVLMPLVLYPVLLYIFSKIYKWDHWKEKLTKKIVLPQ